MKSFAIFFVAMAIFANLITLIAINLMVDSLREKVDGVTRVAGIALTCGALALGVVLWALWGWIDGLSVDGKIAVSAVFMALSIVAVQLFVVFAKQGAIPLPVVICAAVAGVLLGAALFDVTGWPNTQQRQIPWQEWLGILIVIVGVGVAAWGQTTAASRSTLPQSDSAPAATESRNGSAR